MVSSTLQNLICLGIYVMVCHCHEMIYDIHFTLIHLSSLSQLTRHLFNPSRYLYENWHIMAVFMIIAELRLLLAFLRQFLINCIGSIIVLGLIPQQDDSNARIYPILK